MEKKKTFSHVRRNDFEMCQGVKMRFWQLHMIPEDPVDTFKPQIGVVLKSKLFKNYNFYTVANSKRCMFSKYEKEKIDCHKTANSFMFVKTKKQKK